MAEFCRECFIAVWRPNAYDRHHIVMSDDDCLCECCMDYGPYVDRIDTSELREVRSPVEFALACSQELSAGNKVACVECGAEFEHDGLAFVHETGECPYCHQPVQYIWTKKG